MDKVQTSGTSHEDAAGVRPGAGRALPRVTIITSTFNCAAALPATGRSIRRQSYRNIQWIIADGGSTDGTQKWVEEQGAAVNTWFSGPDTGIYDAWNKACSHIDGDWVLFLGAGDELASEHTLADVAEFAAAQEASVVVVYGDVVMRGADGRDRYVDSKPDLAYWEFGRPALPHHQGVFQRRSLFGVPPVFDAHYRIAGDSKFMLQAARQGRFAHMDATVAIMRDDGASNDFRNIWLARHEIRLLCAEMGIAVPLGHRLSANLRWWLGYGAHRLLPATWRRRVRALLDRLRRRRRWPVRGGGG